jgi:hypothetical protein
MESYEGQSSTEIPAWAIEEVRPTPEALQQAQELVVAYALHGEALPWKIKLFEEALDKEVTYYVPEAYSNPKECKYKLTAKLDFAFYVDTPTEIRVGTGEDMSTYTLQPGFWGMEYKTKSASRDRGAWMSEWIMKAQADFQILTLSEYASTQDVEFPIARGILVTVLEYEKKEPPKRKCRGCGKLLPFHSYTETLEGLYACVDCGHASKLKGVEVKEKAPPNIWRLVVTRTEAKLHGALRNAVNAISAMHKMVESEGYGIAWNTTECVPWRGRGCEYLNAHQNWGLADAMSGYVSIDTMKYMTQGKDENVEDK